MATLVDLLAKGYFPAELPPPFTSLAFATVVSSNVANLPGAFTGAGLATGLVYHNLARAGTLRRQLSIPNPVLHFNLCQLVSQHWPTLQAASNISSLSMSKPSVIANSARAVTMQHEQSALPRIHMTARTNARFLLVADISRFYHSIYTHSLPWALHTKATARANKQAPILGNLLDQALRNAQDRQTNGIPIGPDTSLIMAEVLLSAVDQEFNRRSPGTKGFRYIDDYSLSFSNRVQAETALNALQASLAHFSLALNPAKTRIVDLPAPIQPSWVVFLRNHRFSPNPRAQQTDLINHFSRAFDLRAEHPDVHILHYAIGRVRPVTIDRTNWTTLESLLLQCATAEPGVLRLVLDECLQAQGAGYQLNKTAMADALNLIVEQHAPLGHGNEVAWALWGMIAFQLPVSATAASMISDMDDDIVAILALDANRRGLIPRGLNLQQWGASMTQEDLFSNHWLLAYEANVQGWLQSVGPVDHVAADQNFGFLKARGVRFYNLAVPLTSPTVPPWPRAVIQYY